MFELLWFWEKMRSQIWEETRGVQMKMTKKLAFIKKRNKSLQRYFDLCHLHRRRVTSGHVNAIQRLFAPCWETLNMSCINEKHDGASLWITEHVCACVRVWLDRMLDAMLFSFFKYIFLIWHTDSCHLLLKRSLQPSSLVFTFSSPPFFLFLFFFVVVFPFQAVLPGANPCQSSGISGRQTPKAPPISSVRYQLKCQARAGTAAAQLTRADCWKIRKQVCFLRPNLKDFALGLHAQFVPAPQSTCLHVAPQKKKTNGREADKWKNKTKGLWEFWETLAGNRRIPAGSSSGSRCAPQWKMPSVLTSLTSTYYSCTTAHN